jgi:deoxycytidylate deaminase
MRSVINSIKLGFLSNEVKRKVIYCTDLPCIDCLKILLQFGINEIYYAREYAGKYGEENTSRAKLYEMAKQKGVIIEKIEI